MCNGLRAKSCDLFSVRWRTARARDGKVSWVHCRIVIGEIGVLASLETTSKLGRKMTSRRAPESRQNPLDEEYIRSYLLPQPRKPKVYSINPWLHCL